MDVGRWVVVSSLNREGVSAAPDAGVKRKTGPRRRGGVAAVPLLFGQPFQP